MSAWPLPIWVPHQLPRIDAPDAAPVPLRVATPLTLLCLRHGPSCGTAGRRRGPCTPTPTRLSETGTAAIVAQWGAVASPPAAAGASGEGGEGGAVARAMRPPPSAWGGAAPWAVLKTSRRMSEGGSGAAGPRAATGGSRRGEWRRVRLGTVLHAGDWQFLMAQRQAEGAAAAAAAATSAVADMEALSTFFPALHHARYYATARAFAHHCHHSDEHLVWCEDDPIISAEWSAASMETTGASARSGRSSRKSRRRWLSLSTGSHASAAGRSRDAAPLCLHPHTGAAGPAAAACGVASHAMCCTYPLTLHSHGDDSDEAARLAVRAAEVETSSSSFARWFSVLRPACRCAIEMAGGWAEGELDDVRSAAVQEVVAHGLAASLGLWFSARYGPPCKDASANLVVTPTPSPELGGAPLSRLATSAHEPIVAVSALVRDWWAQLCREAEEWRTASVVPPSAQHPLHRGLIAHQVLARCLQARADGLARLSATAIAPPPVLKHVCAACAVVVTRVARQLEGAFPLYTLSPPATTQHMQQSAEGAKEDAAPAAAASHPRCDTDGDTHSGASRCARVGGGVARTDQGAASRRLPRLTAEETRCRHDEYRACMDLVLHVLIADHQEMQRRWSPS